MLILLFIIEMHLVIELDFGLLSGYMLGHEVVTAFALLVKQKGVFPIVIVENLLTSILALILSLPKESYNLYLVGGVLSGISVVTAFLTIYFSIRFD